MLNSFLDPTTVGQFPTEYRERGIRRVLTPKDTPPGVPADATEPRPEDLVPVYDDYRLMPGDQLAVLIDDLLIQGQRFQQQVEVSPTGYIRIPELGQIKAVDMTEAELEADLTATLRESGLLPRPNVQVLFTVRRGWVFTVFGQVGVAGTYPITHPGLRLLDVVGLARDFGATAKKLYIIRQEDLRPWQQPDQLRPQEGDDGLIIPPDNGGGFSALAGDSGLVALASAQDTQPAAADDERAELESVVAPSRNGGRDTGSGSGAREGERQFQPLIFDPQSGDILESKPEKDAEELNEPAPRTSDERRQPGFDWEDVPEYDLSQRVIEIDVPALKSGDPKYNVVIRPQDAINVPVDTGVFYLMGEILRPGVYALSGREVTIKQAIAIGGGFGQLAWPSRVEIIRRVHGTDQQITVPVNLDAIFAGLEDDVLLQDEDIINVGTHPVAPFLFVIRNSFRFTYGFGFVYDRNFADKDQYTAKINPQTLEIQRRQQQGLPF